jgi:hypothetical protein
MLRLECARFDPSVGVEEEEPRPGTLLGGGEHLLNVLLPLLRIEQLAVYANADAKGIGKALDGRQVGKVLPHLVGDGALAQVRLHVACGTLAEIGDLQNRSEVEALDQVGERAQFHAVAAVTVPESLHAGLPV